MASPEIVTAVADTDVKNFGETLMATHALAYQTLARQQGMMGDNAIAIQHGMNTVLVSLVASAAKRIQDLSAQDAVAMTKEMQGNLPTELANLGTAVAGIQETIKAAQTTPPETGAVGWQALQQQVVGLAATVAALEARLAGTKTV